MAVDLQTVTFLSTYRVGFLPPVWGSLAPGELYIEVSPPDAPGPAKLWVGVPDYAETPGGAMSLVPAGLVLEPPPVAPVDPPVNVDTPAVTPMAAAPGDTLNCTMGNWQNEPISYHYLWLRDGAVSVGADSPDYLVVEADLDHALTCTVTAINAIGMTEGPPSNEILVEAPVTRKG